MATASCQRAAEVIAKLESIFEDIADKLLREDSISIPLRYKKRSFGLTSQASNEPSSIRLTHVSWPAKTPEEARRFSIL